MPRLRTLHSRYFVRGATEIARRHGVGLDFGLGLLPSLQDIYVSLDPMGASKEDEKELKAALRRSSKIHPNHPDLLINGFSENQGAACSNSARIASGPFLFLVRLIYSFSTSISD
jgi:hypothetical protein